MGRFTFLRATLPRENCALKSPTRAWALSPNHCRKFSMRSNKAAGHNLEDWVLAWLSAKHLWKRTKEQSLRKAPVETKAPRLRWFFRPAKELRLKLRQRFRPNCRNIKPCGFCLSKIMKIRTDRLRTCFDGVGITCSQLCISSVRSISAQS